MLKSWVWFSSLYVKGCSATNRELLPDSVVPLSLMEVYNIEHMNNHTLRCFPQNQVESKDFVMLLGLSVKFPVLFWSPIMISFFPHSVFVLFLPLLNCPAWLSFTHVLPHIQLCFVTVSVNPISLKLHPHYPDLCLFLDTSSFLSRMHGKESKKPNSISHLREILSSEASGEVTSISNPFSSHFGIAGLPMWCTMLLWLILSTQNQWWFVKFRHKENVIKFGKMEVWLR